MDIYNCKVYGFTYSHHKNSKTNIDELSKNKILSIISAKTGSPINEITKKTQLQYLFNYLASDHINAKTLVTEFNYIDKHYLDDYSKYYSRCFQTHGRECTRIHFFSNNFDENYLTETIENNNSKKYKKLKKNYLGYCVIRPIPENYMGRLSLVPYKRLIDKKETYKLIVQDENISLFGLKLKIKTASMREQDQVVSACATSAVWTALNLTPSTSNHQTPSLSTITDIAIGKSLENRTFINNGLTIKQVSRVLKHYQLEPLEKQLGSTSTYSTMSRWIKAYTIQDIPILLSGKVYNNGVFIGDHFVCIVGYRESKKKIINENLKDNEIVPNFGADKLDRLYVHDDRYGQYIAIRLDDPHQIDGKETKGYPLTNEGLGETPPSQKEDIFIPSGIVIGLDNKIRLNYSEVEDIGYSFFEHLRIAIHMGLINANEKNSKEYKDLIKTFVKESEWNIELISNLRLKEEIRANDNWFESPFGRNKSDLLVKNLPKHMWRIRICKTKLLTDLIFDATEVFQGNILLGYINYTKSSAILWKTIRLLVEERNWDDISNGIKETYGEEHLANASYCISRKLAKKSDPLDELFGALRLPSRDLHSGETADTYIEERPLESIYTIPNKLSKNWPTLVQETPYIWLIDEHGHLLLAEDINKASLKNGHTTLVGYKPARVGGELHYDTKSNLWVVNTISGAYSAHINNEEKQKSIAKIVIEQRFNNFYEELIGLETVSWNENGKRAKKIQKKLNTNENKWIKTK